MKYAEFQRKIVDIITARWFIFALMFVAGVLAPMLKYSVGKNNNIKIFFAAPGHLMEQVDLYSAHAAEHYDFFLYGPIFCLFALPFSLLPQWIGTLLFLATCTAIFLAGVYLLDLTDKQKAVFCLICFFDFLTNSQNFQTNGLVAAFILLAVAMVQRNRDIFAAFFRGVWFFCSRSMESWL